MGEGDPTRTLPEAKAPEVARTFLARTSSIRIKDTGSGERAVTATDDAEIEWIGETARYVVLRELGRGGMGKVDEVFDAVLGRPVARKAVLEESDEHHATLLVAEAQTCAQLEHPSIVPVYELDADEEGRPYYTMRVVPGRTLADALDHGARPGPRMTIAQLLGVLRQVCLAVDYAHSRGVVHRDLKPANVILGDFGEVYVIDWGIAHVTRPDAIHRATYDRIIAGSPGYMAPEQVLGGDIDARTDVFALGVMLYEILAGARPFDDVDFRSVRQRIERPIEVPPSRRDPGRDVPSAFDDLVASCLARSSADRPRSARLIADAIDAFLDGERARLEREKEADAHAREGERERADYEALERRSSEVAERAEAALASLAPWEPVERKAEAWNLAAESRALAKGAAEARARADAAFTRAIGRVADHPGARRGLAALHFRQFEAAESRGDAEQMAQYLELARAYDDGDLALELANEGVLIVESAAPGLEIRAARYEPHGPLLRLGAERGLGRTPTEPCTLQSGSYLVTATHEGRVVRYPVLVQRARSHRVALGAQALGAVPDGMVLVPGGPFRLPEGPRGDRLADATLPDFAIARFPVTLRQYVRFLDALDPATRERRTPGVRGQSPQVSRDATGQWRLGAEWDRTRVPPERELDLPVCMVSWYDAVAYARWLAAETGQPYRLPTSLEWDRAMRGADGRVYPMGSTLDPAFAKVRESRPETTQPEPVGAFPLDESPFGVRDLAGGVGDWTSDAYEGGALPDLDAEGDRAADERRAVWRGGHWGAAVTARHALRYSQQLYDRAIWIGFRLALSLDPGASSGVRIERLGRPR